MSPTPRFAAFHSAIEVTELLHLRIATVMADLYPAPFQQWVWSAGTTSYSAHHKGGASPCPQFDLKIDPFVSTHSVLDCINLYIRY